MGKVKSINIILKNTQSVFYSGQIIEGNVIVNVSEEVKVREIRLRLHGYANVHWTEQHGSGKHRHTVHYSAKETYIDAITPVLSPPQGSDNLMLKPGQHEYPFRWQLPPGCPTSYESHIGQVRYSLQVCIDRPWAFDDNYKMMFTVLNVYDLNRVPNAAHGATAENSKTLCCLCCKSGPITAKLSLDRIGYVPGESIIIKAEANNGSNRTMSSSFARIVMSVSYITRRKTRVVNTDIAKISKGEISKGDSEVWYGEKLVVPPVPASELPGCNIINIRYLAVFTVDPAGPAFDLDVPIDIIIGTIPLQQALQQYGIQPPSTTTQLNYDETSFGPPPSAVTPAYPPPSYSASVLGGVNVNHGDDDDDNNAMATTSKNAVHPGGNTGDQFTPMYTYYTWN